jgi:hypothetical protein
MFIADLFDTADASFDNQSAVFGDFLPTAFQQFSGQNTVMTEKSVDAVRVNVSRAIVVKG